MFKKALNVSVLSILILISLTCKKSPIEPESSSIRLNLEDVTCTEAWSRLYFYEFTPPVKADLILNDKIVKTFNITT
ncbi:MAG: hypothetical protein N3F03_01190, partial [Ignavibacteria bacterium]|nr:hypothetical protein [Ignavibacteria bacterium]